MANSLVGFPSINLGNYSPQGTLGALGNLSRCNLPVQSAWPGAGINHRRYRWHDSYSTNQEETAKRPHNSATDRFVEGIATIVVHRDHLQVMTVAHQP